jgi:hypothetical protein
MQASGPRSATQFELANHVGALPTPLSSVGDTALNVVHNNNPARALHLTRASTLIGRLLKN